MFDRPAAPNQPFQSTKEEEELGALLANLCENGTLLGQSNCKVFQVNTSASPLLSALTPLPSVAVKELKHPSPKEFNWSAEWKTMMNRIQRECKDQLKLAHENVVQFYAIGSTADCK